MHFELFNSVRAVIVTAAIVVSAVTVGTLSVNQWRPSVFAGFGEEAGANTEFIVETLGADVVLRSGLGHDGRFFFVQALDPAISDPELYRVAVDRPTYRAQRILYALLAGGFGFLPPGAVVWGMLLVNAVGLVVGTAVTARLAKNYHLTPWLGMAFLLNPGLIDEFAIGGAGILALGLAVGAIAALEKEQWPIAGLLFLAAVLSREVMLLAVVGAVAFEWRWHRRVPWQVVAWPVVGTALWYLYVRYRLGVPDRVVQELTVFPFGDLMAAVRSWANSFGTLVMGVILLVGAPYIVWWSVKRKTRVTWVTGSFVFLLPFLTDTVMRDHFNFGRAMAPVFIALAFTTVQHGMAGAQTSLTPDKRR